jgi:hypothetical protein
MKLNQYAWIIPILPALAATFVGIGLLSFRNANRNLRSLYAILSITMLVFIYGLG